MLSPFLDRLFGDVTAGDALVAAVDIIIVYYLIYRVLLTIKGTRAMQMVIGIVLIGAAFFAAERFHLATSSWLLDNFMNYFVFIIIVVFQQDIRRALMRIGQNVSQWGRTHEISHALDEVIAAAEHLAKARLGGLVVFEREATLDQFADHGGVIDAVLSKELLVSLFVPSRDNELHDGAVVIRNWRIDRAGAVLPLSRSSLASDFGTRHRAALGITEETDAVALVISEERGEVSLCFRGSIARDLEGETLRSALQSMFQTEKTSGFAAEEAQAAAAIAKAVAAMAGEDASRADVPRVPTAGNIAETGRIKAPRTDAVRIPSTGPAEEGGTS